MTGRATLGDRAFPVVAAPGLERPTEDSTCYVSAYLRIILCFDDDLSVFPYLLTLTTSGAYLGVGACACLRPLEVKKIVLIFNVKKAKI